MRFPEKAKALICCGGGPALTELEIQEIIQDEEKLLLDSKTEEVMRSKHSHIYGEAYWKTLVKHLHQLLVEGYSEGKCSQIVIPTLIMCGHEMRRRIRQILYGLCASALASMLLQPPLFQNLRSIR